MKKKIEITGPNGIFKGQINIDKGVSPVQTHNPSTHEDGVRNVEVWNVNAFIGTRHQSDIGQKEIRLTSEGHLLDVVKAAEKELTRRLTSLANDQPKSDLEKTLSDMGYTYGSL